MKFRISHEVRDLISHLHSDIKQKIRMALSEIIKNLSCGKSLGSGVVIKREGFWGTSCGELQGMRSFRVSKFRIIYRSASDVIEVIALGPRRTIYEETLRLIQREEQK
ncbi:MAG: type II toxin-antitoxin system RelE family toxin [Ignavibacteriales bacterium]